MMSAGGTYISTASVEVPQALQDGEKFIKWDDVSTIQTDLQLPIERMWMLLYNLLHKYFNYTLAMFIIRSQPNIQKSFRTVIVIENGAF